MNRSLKHQLVLNLNRLAIVTSVMVILKLFTYFFQEFLPVFGQVISSLFSAFLPFILALLIALVMEPIVVQLMQVLKLKRSYAAVLSLILVILGIGLFISLILVRLYNELSDLSITMPDYNYLMALFNQQIDSFEKFIVINPQIQATLNSSLASLLKSMQSWAASASLALLSFLAAVPGFLFVLVVAIVAALLVSSSFPGIKRFFVGLVPRNWHAGAQTVSQDLGSAIIGFLRAETILISITGLTLTVGLLLMGNRYAFTMGFLAAFLDLLPIVGTGILFVPWIIGLILMRAVSDAVKLLVIWVIAIVIRQMLEPKIMSKSIGLHPLPTLISMYVGLKLLGGAGLVIGPGLVILYEALRKSGIFTDPRT
ncbi:sporulation integral membrane protein YtvI [Desulfitobacterium sp. Sab5]|uniref:sporulation integral membrane protein YtvI n=1 Tax=Desulfitobacterium nosdiversum TaxID=3375356 RepID=UPI003CF432FD